MTPTKKNAMLAIITGIRPKIWLKLAKLGWNTVDARRKDVPAQKASMAVPWSFFAMMGRATDMEVPSSATMRVRTARQPKARMRRVETLNSGGVVVSLVLSLREVMEDEDEVICEV